MFIPAEINRKFGVKVFSCKKDTLQREQQKRKESLYNYLTTIRNEPLERTNTIRPASLQRIKNEKACSKFINTLLKIYNIQNT